jgi:hypothetical protein
MLPKVTVVTFVLVSFHVCTCCVALDRSPDASLIAPDPENVLRAAGVQTSTDVLKRNTATTNVVLQSAIQGIPAPAAVAPQQFRNFLGIRSPSQLVQGPTTAAAGPSSSAWSGYISAAGGYDNSREGKERASGAGAFEGIADVVFDKSLTSTDSVSIEYTFDSLTLTQQSDTQDHNLAFDYLRSLTDHLKADLFLNDEFSLDLTQKQTNIFTARPSLVYLESSWTATKLSYAFKDLRQYIDSSPDNDGDGTSNSIAVAQSFDLGSILRNHSKVASDLSTRMSYAATWKQTEGRNRIQDSNSILFGVSYTIPVSLVNTFVDATYSRTFVSYQKVDSVLRFRQSTQMDKAHVQLTRAFHNAPNLQSDRMDRLSVFTSYDLSNSVSNSHSKGAKEHTAEVGFIWKF